MSKDHSPCVLYVFSFDTSSFICSYFEVLLTLWFEISLFALTYPLRDQTAKYFIKSQNDRRLRERKACSAMASYVALHWCCSFGTDCGRKGSRDCLSCLSLNHNSSRAARMASSKESDPNGLGLDQDKHLQCYIPLPPGHCMQTAVLRLYNANGNFGPLSPLPAQGSLLIAFLC